MYTGGGNQWLLAATTTCMLFATSSFSLVLLRLGLGTHSVLYVAGRNLTIGMYTKFYEMQATSRCGSLQTCALQEPLARLAFQQCRARTCMIFMLRPTVPCWILARMGQRGWTPPAARSACGLVAMPCFLLHFIVVFWLSDRHRGYVAGVLLFMGLLISQASLLISNSHLDNRHRYLWVSLLT